MEEEKQKSNSRSSSGNKDQQQMQVDNLKQIFSEVDKKYEFNRREVRSGSTPSVLYVADIESKFDSTQKA